jgi:hypothetical protein
MTDERRSAPRVIAYLAGEIETSGGKTSVAITRDVAANGLLLLSRSQFAIGDGVSLTILSGSGGEARRVQVRGKVVRQDKLEPGESDLWRTKVALAVEPSPALSQLLEKARAT